jgi:hypothetical protein
MPDVSEVFFTAAISMNQAWIQQLQNNPDTTGMDTAAEE